MTKARIRVQAGTAALALAAVLPFGCDARSPSVAHTYEACGVCFEAQERLARVLGHPWEGCAFEFVGRGLLIHGNHSEWAHNVCDEYAPSSWVHPGGLGRECLIAGWLGYHAAFVVFLEGTERSLPIYFAVSHGPDGKAAAEQMAASVRDCDQVAAPLASP